MRDLLFALLRPDYWVMLYPYSSAWDKFINDIVDNEQQLDFSPTGYTVNVGAACIWIENYPAAYGTSYSNPLIPRIRPKRITVSRLHKYIKQQKEKNTAVKLKEVKQVYKDNVVHLNRG